VYFPVNAPFFDIYYSLPEKGQIFNTLWKIFLCGLDLQESTLYDKRRFNMSDVVLTGYPSIDRPWMKYYSKDALSSALPKCTAYEYLYEKNKDNLRDIALNYCDQKFTYGQLFESIESAAKAFSALGVKKGDVVVICSINIPETVYAIYGLNRLGAISNMVDPRTNEDQLRQYINECNAKLVITVDAAYPIIENAMEGSTANHAVVVSPSDSLSSIMGAKSSAIVLQSNAIRWREFIQQGIYEKPAYPEYEENRCFVIAHTGGTSGEPKGVMLSDDCLNAIAQSYYYVPVPLERRQRYFNDLPPFIIYGLSFALHMTLCRGFEVIICPVFDSVQFPKLYAKYKPNHFCAVPEHLSHLIDDPATQNINLSFTISVGTGGDSLNTKLEERTNKFLKDHGCRFKVTKGYGMTETGAVAISTFPNVANEVGSVGIPLCYNNMKIMDLNLEEELSYDKIGEIWISSPSIMLGYYKNTEATKKIIVTDSNGIRWIRTGDLGRITKEGLLIHEGRIRRIYLTFADGQPAKIFPMVVENIIKKSECVDDCAVVGRLIKNSSYYEAVAYVVLRQDVKTQKNIEKDIITLCKNNVPTYMQPVEYRFVEELPHTPIGKVDFRKLESLSQILDES